MSTKPKSTKSRASIGEDKNLEDKFINPKDISSGKSGSYVELANTLILKCLAILLNCENNENDVKLPTAVNVYTKFVKASKIMFSNETKNFVFPTGSMGKDLKLFTIDELIEEKINIKFDLNVKFEELNSTVKKILMEEEDKGLSETEENEETKNLETVVRKEKIEEVKEGKKTEKVEKSKPNPDDVNYLQYEDYEVFEYGGMEFYASNLVDYEQMKVDFKKTFISEFPDADINSIGAWLNLTATSKNGTFKVYVSEKAKIDLNGFTKRMAIKNYVKSGDNLSLDRKVLTIARLQRCFVEETVEFLRRAYLNSNEKVSQEASNMSRIKKMKWYGFPTVAYLRNASIRDCAYFLKEIEEWEKTWVTKSTEQNARRFSKNIVNFLETHRRMDLKKLEKFINLYSELSEPATNNEIIDNYVSKKSLEINGFICAAEVIEEVRYIDAVTEFEKLNAMEESRRRSENEESYNFGRITRDGKITYSLVNIKYDDHYNFERNEEDEFG